VNKANVVNIDRLSPREMERLLMARFRDILGEVFPQSALEISAPPARSLGIAFVAGVKLPAGPHLEFLVECKSQPRPSQVPEAPGGTRDTDVPSVAVEREFAKNHTLKRVRSWVLAAPFVSPRLAEVCWDRGWGWFDLAGNCRLSLPGLLYVERKGNPPVHQSARAEANLGTPEAARVLRALLNSEPAALCWKSQRDLQKATEPAVSLGLVNKIVSHLRSEGHLANDGADGLRVVDPEKLLLAWRDAYRPDRLVRAEWFTLLKAPEIEKAMRELNRGGETRIAWAAFSAAERQAPMVRQPKYWLMASEAQTEWIHATLKATPVESGANLILLVAPDPGYLAAAKEEDRAGPCTHPLQTFLDTWHAGGRGQEAAQAVLERRLRPSWERLTAP
jgi:hypothetical protein